MSTIDKGHPADRIRARLGAIGITGVERQQISGRVMLSLDAALRVADLLDLLSQIRGESLLEATSLDLERQAGGRVWTVRIIIARSPSQIIAQRIMEPSFADLLASNAIRMLSPSAGNADSADVVELAAPANVTPAASREWAVLVADRLAGLGFNAAAAPAWGRS